MRRAAILNNKITYNIGRLIPPFLIILVVIFIFSLNKFYYSIKNILFLPLNLKSHIMKKSGGKKGGKGGGKKC